MFAYVMKVHIYQSTFIIFCLAKFFLFGITLVPYCHPDLVVAFFIDFICRLDYSFFHLGLLRSFSDNFVYYLSLLDQ
jgi:hypothetical protein